MKALCCILNYNCNDNSDYLYNEFNKYCEAHVLDSDSKNPYPYFENVTNKYYTHQFNISIKKFKEGNYSNLIIITGDVKISKEAIKYVCQIANYDMGTIGVLSLQTNPKSRDWWNPFKRIGEHEIKNNRYETNICEGFFNIIHKDVVNMHKEIPLDINKYGVCIDMYTARIANNINKKCIIDLKYLIHHPKEKSYNFEESHSYDEKFNKWIDKNLK